MFMSLNTSMTGVTYEEEIYNHRLLVEFVLINL